MTQNATKCASSACAVRAGAAASDEERSVLLASLIHCADVSNPLLPHGMNVRWASLIVQEFNAQVELERHLGLPTTLFMDVRSELARQASSCISLFVNVLLLTSAEGSVLGKRKASRDSRDKQKQKGPSGFVGVCSGHSLKSVSFLSLHSSSSGRFLNLCQRQRPSLSRVKETWRSGNELSNC